MKRIMTAILSLVLCMGAICSFVGCESKCAHNVDDWEMITEASCSKNGLQRGTCDVCYETVEKVIPVNPEAHAYGEWDVLSTPTETETGRASNTCSENSAHTLTVDLPALGSKEYKSQITLRPTAEQDGERTYVMKQGTGEIRFTKPIPKDGVKTVRDAVGLGVSAESKGQVRKATGKLGYERVAEGNAKGTIDCWNYIHEYEFGEGALTYSVEKDLKDSESIKRWYFKDENGKLYGLTDFTTDGSEKIVDDLATSNGNKRYIDGCRIFIPYYGGASAVGEAYGVEDFLDKLYSIACTSTNNDFVEYQPKEENGKTVYSFSFGEAQNDDYAISYFTRTTVSFALTTDYVIENVKVQAINYVNDRENGISTWQYNENGIAQVLSGKEGIGERYLACVEFEQTLKEEGETLLENEHKNKLDKMYAQRFDVEYVETGRKQVLNEDGFLPNGERVRFVFDTTDRMFSIVNVIPKEAVRVYGLEKFKVYLRAVENGKQVDKLISHDTIDTVGVSIDMDKEWRFFLNAKKAGERTIVVKTSTGIERLIQCEIGAAAPIKLNASVYEYSFGKYTWATDYEEGTVNQTIHTYQAFVFTAEVPQDEKNYASASHYVKITDEAGKVVVDTKKEGFANAWFDISSKEGRTVSVFCPEKAGKYTIEMISVLDISIQTTIHLTVVDAPTFKELTMTSDAEGREYASITALPSLSYVDLTFKRFEETEDTCTVVAVIAVSGRTTELTCVYDKKERELTSTYLKGDFEGKMKLSINDASDFVLNYFSEVGENETVVMKAISTEE